MRRIFAYILILALLFASAGIGLIAFVAYANAATPEGIIATPAEGCEGDLSVKVIAPFDLYESRPPQWHEPGVQQMPNDPIGRFVYGTACIDNGRNAQIPPGRGWTWVHFMSHVPASPCLPGFFWRVYPDGNGECWPWD